MEWESEMLPFLPDDMSVSAISPFFSAAPLTEKSNLCALAHYLYPSFPILVETEEK